MDRHRDVGGQVQGKHGSATNERGRVEAGSGARAAGAVSRFACGGGGEPSFRQITTGLHVSFIFSVMLSPYLLHFFSVAESA